MPIRELSDREVANMDAMKARDRWGVRRKKIRRSIKFFVILAAVAIYLNIGWGSGSSSITSS